MKNITLNPSVQYAEAQIKAYLNERPSATETLEGIHQYWLSSFEPLETTSAALTLLEEQGLVQQLQVGNRLVWRRMR